MSVKCIFVSFILRFSLQLKSSFGTVFLFNINKKHIKVWLCHVPNVVHGAPTVIGILIKYKSPDNLIISFSQL